MLRGGRGMHVNMCGENFWSTARTVYRACHFTVNRREKVKIPSFCLHFKCVVRREETELKEFK